MNNIIFFKVTMQKLLTKIVRQTDDNKYTAMILSLVNECNFLREIIFRLV